MANTDQPAGRVLTLSPGSRTDDGLLDVCVIASKQRLDYWTTVVQMLMPPAAWRRTSPLKGAGISWQKHITITSRPRLKVQADGMLAEHRPP
ncbi:MAG: hypothetical protein R2857_01430 [Vampirovibrionales bacterium]